MECFASSQNAANKGSFTQKPHNQYPEATQVKNMQMYVTETLSLCLKTSGVSPVSCYNLCSVGRVKMANSYRQKWQNWKDYTDSLPTCLVHRYNPIPSSLQYTILSTYLHMKSITEPLG